MSHQGFINGVKVVRTETKTREQLLAEFRAKKDASTKETTNSRLSISARQSFYKPGSSTKPRTPLSNLTNRPASSVRRSSLKATPKNPTSKPIITKHVVESTRKKRVPTTSSKPVSIMSHKPSIKKAHKMPTNTNTDASHSKAVAAGPFSIIDLKSGKSNVELNSNIDQMNNRLSMIMKSSVIPETPIHKKRPASSTSTPRTARRSSLKGKTEQKTTSRIHSKTKSSNPTSFTGEYEALHAILMQITYANAMAQKSFEGQERHAMTSLHEVFERIESHREEIVSKKCQLVHDQQVYKMHELLRVQNEFLVPLLPSLEVLMANHTQVMSNLYRKIHTYSIKGGESALETLIPQFVEGSKSLRSIQEVLQKHKTKLAELCSDIGQLTTVATENIQELQLCNNLLSELERLQKRDLSLRIQLIERE